MSSGDRRGGHQRPRRSTCRRGARWEWPGEHPGCPTCRRSLAHRLIYRRRNASAFSICVHSGAGAGQLDAQFCGYRRAGHAHTHRRPNWNFDRQHYAAEQCRAYGPDVRYPLLLRPSDQSSCTFTPETVEILPNTTAAVTSNVVIATQKASSTTAALSGANPVALAFLLPGALALGGLAWEHAAAPGFCGSRCWPWWASSPCWAQPLATRATTTSTTARPSIPPPPPARIR